MGLLAMLLVAVTPVRAIEYVRESGVTELIGADEQVDASEYSGSVAVTLKSQARYGYIEQVTFISRETGTGSVQTPAGTLYIFDANPAIASGDTALALLGAEHQTVIGMVTIVAGDWQYDTSGAVAHIITSMPFHPLSILYYSWRLAAGATSLNDAAGDNEILEFNCWYRQN